MSPWFPGGRRAAALILALVVALPTARPAFAAWSTDSQVNNPVCVGAWSKGSPVSTSDGAGGVIVAWEDSRGALTRVYVQHILADGSIAPGWPTTGIHLTPSNNSKSTYGPAICSDGAGGAVITFRYLFSPTDNDIYAERISGAGTILWDPFGVAVAGSSVDQSAPQVATDGAGGAFVVWTEGGLSSDVYGDHIVAANGANAAGWAVGGNVLCNAPAGQFTPRMAADGAGGLLAIWIDQRGPSANALYATRVQGGGSLASGWTVNGASLMTTQWPINDFGMVATPAGGLIAAWSENESADMNVRSGALGPTGANQGGSHAVAVYGGTDQFIVSLAPDARGGAFAFWDDDRGGDYDIFTCRLTGTGEIAAGWPAGGIPLGASVGTQDGAVGVPDGTGGCFAVWSDPHLGGSYDLFAGHVLSTPLVAEGWSSAGSAVGTAQASQFLQSIVADGAGGAIVSFLDYRSLSNADVYCQRVERYGQLGNPEPSIASVRDVANDQGGSVRVSWNASHLDAYPTLGVTEYWLWRQVPAALARAALAAGARLDDGEADTPSTPGRRFRAVPASAEAFFWEYVGTQVANGFTGYSRVTSTASDSVPGSFPRTVFMVEARGGGNIHWDSAPDSGYSVDNLAPAAPAPFGALYAAGRTYLHWGPNSEPDLDGYRLYRGATAGFTPAPANRIATPPDTGFVDQNGGFYYYKLSAVDVHGNESPFALAFPTGTTDAPGSAPRALSFAGATPNPMRGPGALAWTLARDGRVRLTLFDVGGRRVRELVDGPLPAGAHAARWDLCDERGAAVGSGVYFAVLEAGGRTLRSRIGVVR